MTRIVFSKHAIEDRTDRIVKIATAMGFGEVIEEFPSENYMGPTRHCLTNTGVIIVKPRDKEEVITMFAVSETKMLTGMVIDYLHNLSRVVIIPGENEMEALALGALRILNGEETARTFQPACALTIR